MDDPPYLVLLPSVLLDLRGGAASTEALLVRTGVVAVLGLAPMTA